MSYIYTEEDFRQAIRTMKTWHKVGIGLNVVIFLVQVLYGF